MRRTGSGYVKRAAELFVIDEWGSDSDYGVCLVEANINELDGNFRDTSRKWRPSEVPQSQRGESLCRQDARQIAGSPALRPTEDDDAWPRRSWIGENDALKSGSATSDKGIRV